MKTREICLVSRPKGWPSEADFESRDAEIGELSEGKVLLRVLWLSVDPYMRGRMNDVKSYVPPFKLGEAISGGGIAQVVESRDPRFQPGDFVSANLKWREFDVQPGETLRKLDPDQAPLSAHLGVLGMPGLTAFVGLRRIGELRPSDTVYVSAAAGAVGSIAGQIAKISGAKVIGSAGSDQKVRALLEMGFDSAFNYREVPVAKALSDYAPGGIDLYFDNVGGEHLEAALYHMSDYGRVVMCGAVSQYNLDNRPAGPSNLMLVVTKRLTLKGFIVSDHNDLYQPFLSEVSGWLRHGKLQYRHTEREGLSQAPRSLIDMMRGENLGKMLVKVADPN